MIGLLKCILVINYSAITSKGIVTETVLCNLIVASYFPHSFAFGIFTKFLSISTLSTDDINCDKVILPNNFTPADTFALIFTSNPFNASTVAFASAIVFSSFLALKHSFLFAFQVQV